MKTIVPVKPVGVRRPLALLTVAVLTLAFIGLLNADPSSETSANGSDCRLFTATPTVSPTPTPSPPWVPAHSQLICNDTDQVVNDLHIVVNREVDNAEPVSYGLTGCPSPTWVYDGAVPPAYDNVALFWDDPCVEPGEYVHAFFQANCTTPEPGCSVPHIECAYWTLDAVFVPPASPAINPSVCSSPAYTATPFPTPAPTPVPGGPVGGQVELIVPAPTDGSAGPGPIWVAIALSVLAVGAAFVLGYRRSGSR